MNYEILQGIENGQNIASSLVSLALSIAVMVAWWKIFEKMGIEGWKTLIPFYNMYVLFDRLYGQGSKSFLLLIPFYNFFVSNRMYADLARGFGKEPAFVFGLAFVSQIFLCILGFDKDEYTSYDNDDPTYYKNANIASWIGVCLFAFALIMFAVGISVLIAVLS